ncbi:MAG: hypothetical protein HRU14_07510 [Planctomycetes bacterium]|nr:hypothetical protein [Planctomycetota bacterium]
MKSFIPLSAPLALLFVACAILAGGVSAQSITTPPNFVSNNGGSPGGAVYFDVTVISPGGLFIESFDCNTSLAAGGAVDIDVFICPTTSVGNETNTGVWNQVCCGSGTALGLNLATSFDTSDFQLLPGTYGMAILNSGGHRYTNGDGTNQAVATPEMSLALGTASNVPFTAGIFSPRIWNGTIHYATTGASGICVLDRQPNNAEASLTVNGGSAAALSNGAAAAVDMNSANAGSAWDVGLVPGAPSIGLAQGGLVTPGGQSINLDLSNPAFFFLNNNFASGGGFPAAGIALAYPENNYSVSGQMAVISASHADGVSLSQACDLSWTGCSGSNFDNLSAGTSPPPGWTNQSTPWVALASSPWTVDAAGTPSGATGPTAAASGANYMYCETSGTGGTAEFNMETCAFDTPASTLSFNLSRIGATIGTLNIYVAFNGNWNSTPIATYTGADPGQLQGGTEWSAESITLSAFPLGTSNVTFAFSYTGGGSFTGDIAIDDVAVN